MIMTRGDVERIVEETLARMGLTPRVVDRLVDAAERPGRAKMLSRRMVRYSASGYTHADFHAKIHEDPDEKTAALAYADWLEENGHGAAAEIIRGHQTQNPYGTHVGFGGNAANPNSFRGVWFGFSDKPSVVLTTPLMPPDEKRTSLQWHYEVGPDRAAAILSGIRKSGGSLNESGAQLADIHDRNNAGPTAGGGDDVVRASRSGNAVRRGVQAGGVVTGGRRPFRVGRQGHPNQDRRKYARLTLSPPRPFKGPAGEAMAEHDYRDETGRKLGVIRLIPRNDGRTLHVHWIGPENAAAGEVAHTAGAEGMRSLVPELLRHYPAAEFATGLRAGGFRGKTGERVVVPLRPKTPTEPKPMQRRGTPIKKAKVDGHEKAHPLVEGFPLEFFLRHLANDPKNHDTIRGVAKSALTGKGIDGQAVDVPSSLWVLRDALHDHDHPMKDHYNLMSAADKVGLDRHTHTALTEVANRAKIGVAPEHHDLTAYSPGWQARRAEAALVHPNAPDPAGANNKAILDAVTRRVHELTGGQWQDKDVHESIRRHALRHRSHVQTTWGDHTHKTIALSPKGELTDKTNLAARYRRKDSTKSSIPDGGGGPSPRKFAQKPGRGDFIDALRRIKSKNNQTLHQIAHVAARSLGL